MRVRAFSLLELMTVVAIVGLLATLAVPSLGDMSRHYRAVETSRSVLSAFAQGRAQAQRDNLPVEMAVLANGVEIRKGVPDSNPALFNPEAARRLLASFATDRVVTISGLTVNRLEFMSGNTVTSTVTPGSATAVVRFCPGSDGYFRIGATQDPVCGTGNLASVGARMVFTVNGETFNVRLKAPLASIDLKQGAI